MSLLAAIRWARTAELPELPRSTVTCVLANMLNAAEVIANQDAPLALTFEETSGDQWIFQLWQHRDEFIRADGPLFLQLLHVLEKGYLRHLLAGDQVRIRRHLHSSLKKAHNELDGCSDLADGGGQCPWISHSCSAAEWQWPYYTHCHLLRYSTGPTL